jgi:sugar lactone lactonase YvrE
MRLRFASSSLFVFSTLLMTGCSGSKSASSVLDGGGDMPPNLDMGADMFSDMSTNVDAGPRIQTLSFVAGGLGGIGDADGTGTAARFNRPAGTALDDEGNLYVSDSGSCVIRKIEAQTNAVTTLAGTASVCDSTDSVGIHARFNGPSGLTFGITDTNEKKIYVADSNNFTIRAIDLATQQVTTLAGSAGQRADSGSSGDGTGDTARFRGLIGLTIDNTGSNLYAVDAGNFTIRKIDIKARAVTTIAGVPGTKGILDCTGAVADADGGATDGGTTTGGCTPADSRFRNPMGVAYGMTSDGQEILYVVDSGSFGQNVIRQVFLADNRVTTLAKGGSPILFASPTGVTLQGTSTLFVSDIGNQVIRRIDIATGDVTLLAGNQGMGGNSDGTGSDAMFNRPRLMTLDPNGALLVPDELNHIVRKVETAGANAGTVTTLAGAVAHSGIEDGTGGQARFNAPAAMTSDGDGNLYVADALNSTIRRVAADGTVTTIAGTALTIPNVGENGDGTGTDALFGLPTGIAYAKTGDSAGYLYVADSGSNIVRQIDLNTKVVTTIAGTAGTYPPFGENGDGTGAGASFGSLSALASDGGDNLYIPDTFANLIRKMVISTQEVTTIVNADAGLSFPSGVALDGQGNLYIADSSNQTIQRLVLATNELSVVAGSVGQPGYLDTTASGSTLLNNPGSISFDGTNLYIAEPLNHAVRKLNLISGKVTTLAGTIGVTGTVPGPLPASLNSPLAVWASSPSEIFISDENSILRVH